MELQAIRYAAMVSSMGFSEVADAYAANRAKHRPGEEVTARAELAAFLDAAEGSEEPVISTDVRIILVSADFGREITTTVLWLNGYDGMDIRCIRLVPYDIDGKVLLDIQQVLPLAEAADYQVRLRRKDVARERARSDGRDFTRYHIVVDGVEQPHQNKRKAIRTMVKELAARGAPLAEIRRLLPARVMRVVPGRLSDADAVAEALLAADPKVDTGRFYCDHPMVDDDAGETYVLSRMWGLQTEPALTALAQAFPNAGVSFRRAEDDE